MKLWENGLKLFSLWLIQELSTKEFRTGGKKKYMTWSTKRRLRCWEIIFHFLTDSIKILSYFLGGVSQNALNW